MEYDKLYKKKEGPLLITTKKDETGAIVIVEISQVRSKNLGYNEEVNKTKGEDQDV